MDMSGMSMSMGTSMFQSENMALARAYWYIIVGVLGLLLAIRGINFFSRQQRLRKCSSSAVQFPTKPTGRVSQTWATLTAVGREMSYPQLYVSSRFFSWMTPPPTGRVLVLLIYWAVVVYMMTANAIIKDINFWERIGFRNAWVTVTQLPLLYLLASKSSVLGMIAGTSYERLNWLHRWVARTMFVTATVHGWHFWVEWERAEILDLMLDMMPMVRWGLAAWGLLLWSIVAGFLPIRHLWYELFVCQHVLTSIAFLYVIYIHVPDYARYNVWFAIAALCFDRFYRSVLLIWQNVKVRPQKTKCKGGQRIGHQAQIRAVGEDITIVTIKDVHFSWRAGQHLYLWMPKVDATGHHPYTIASAHMLPDTCICNSIQIVVRKHRGFSRRLHDTATKMQAAGKKDTFTAFVTGPYGLPPRWDIYETLILISASTGASFTLPILESVINAKANTLCTKRIDFLLASKKGDEIDYYVHRLHDMINRAADVGIELSVHIAVTRGPPTAALVEEGRNSEKHASLGSSVSPLTPTDKADGATSVDVEKSAVRTSSPRSATRPGSSASNDSRVHQTSSRPDIESFIRGPVEATGGETSVVVCGGKPLVARARNCVARLSDERAVHKGTGAQGIHLHVEEYCF